MDAERVALGRPGYRQTYAGGSMVNPIAGIPGVPPGTRLEFRDGPTRFTGADAMAVLPSARAEFERSLGASAGDVAQIQVSKQASTAIFPERVATPSALHFNGGVQHRLDESTALSVDVVYRRFADVPLGGGGIDLNRFTRPAGPVLPLCSPPEARDPQAICSRGPIIVYQAPFRFDYTGGCAGGGGVSAVAGAFHVKAGL
jgi:hypothetical protein